MPTLERNAPWSRCTVSLRSRRQRERLISTGDSEEITTLFGTSVPPALPNDHENTSKASRAFTLRPHLSEMRLGAGVQLALVLVDSAKDRNRRAILRKITTLFGTSVPPALPNGMENCARCDWGLTTLSSEVNLRFIALLSLFDRTQGHICGGKAGRLT